jgi:peptidyl-tRNA hydrolase, PTH1 family
MILIVGLGNPGEKFKGTRHNIGFKIIEKFAQENEFPEFKPLKKVDSLISEKVLNGKKITLLKPQTFMNNSGIAVKKFLKNREAKTWIVHDEADLNLGEIKISENRGSAGHKGIQSIIDNLGTKELTRFRIGIGPKENLESFVIKKFKEEEKEKLKETIKKAVRIIERSLKEGIEKTKSSMNEE